VSDLLFSLIFLTLLVAEAAVWLWVSRDSHNVDIDDPCADPHVAPDA